MVSELERARPFIEESKLETNSLNVDNVSPISTSGWVEFNNTLRIAWVAQALLITCWAKNIFSSLESRTTFPEGSSPWIHLKRKINPWIGLKSDENMLFFSYKNDNENEWQKMKTNHKKWKSMTEWNSLKVFEVVGWKWPQFFHLNTSDTEPLD